MKKEMENLLNQAQLYQQQMQAVVTQKTALSLELNEIEKALEELKKTKEKSVFRVSGPLLIKADTKDVIRDMNEKEDYINLKMKTISRQEVKIKEKLEELREKLEKSQAKEAG